MLAEAVYRSCAHKARIVANDEKEQGERALLNLGHTFGHAIESYLGYGEWLHGEAVAVRYGDGSTTCRIVWGGLVQKIYDVQKISFYVPSLPAVCPKIPLDEFLSYMSHDKKVLNGQLRLVLMKQLGTSYHYQRHLMWN